MPGRQSRQPMLNWRTSKASGGSGNCLEIVGEEGLVLVRDSRNPSGTILEFPPGPWTSFLRRVRSENGISAER
jgi:hypothetical protein